MYVEDFVGKKSEFYFVKSVVYLNNFLKCIERTMSKRNQVQFSRPEDPKFLKLIKEQIGYNKNEPSVDTKVG